MIRLDNITAVRKNRTAELAGRIDTDTVETVSIAFRAALDL